MSVNDAYNELMARTTEDYTPYFPALSSHGELVRMRALFSRLNTMISSGSMPAMWTRDDEEDHTLEKDRARLDQMDRRVREEKRQRDQSEKFRITHDLSLQIALLRVVVPPKRVADMVKALNDTREAVEQHRAKVEEDDA